MGLCRPVHGYLQSVSGRRDRSAHTECPPISIRLPCRNGGWTGCLRSARPGSNRCEEVDMGEFGLRIGTADIRSAGPITFGPAGILFLADNGSAKVFAVDVADPVPAAGSEPFDLENVDVRVGSFLGCDADDIAIWDLAIHPITHNVYLSVQRGRGDAGRPVRVRIDRLDGSITDVALEDVPVAEVTIADAPGEDDERQDVTLPRGAEGEELQVGERT